MTKAIRIIIICVLALVVATIGVAAVRTLDFDPPVTLLLNGEGDIYVEYGQEYTEQGAVATLSDAQEKVPVTIVGQADTSRLGDYLIKYIASFGGHTTTAYRCVHVIDSEAPVITLTSDPKSYTLIGEAYLEEGFTATDNYDGVLTNQVVCKEIDGVMHYSVADSSGNVTTVTRTINYVNPDAPILTLEGGQTCFIMAGEQYAEPGYVATDLRDGDLSANVIVSGDVDGNIPGIYTLKYTISNSVGMDATRERIIYVIPKQTEDEPPSAEILPNPGTVIEPNGKTIYLTFDDGPSSHTARLLDVLKKYNVKASFFVTSSAYMDVLTRAAKEGHTIAIHTNSHDYSKIYASDEAFMADLEAIQSKIQQYTGIKSMLTRFPGGSSNSVSSAYSRGIMTRLTKKLHAMGYQYFDWNVDSNDAGGARTAKKVFENVTKGIAERQNSVVLQHDTKGYSVDAVEQIIAWGLCNGYTFKALDKDSPACHHSVRN
ncbi:MAG: polysaccharide deacetylase family protein [Oscillospiraceae bacterium]|nr:polysaccharide deacetylase family protein [Oscillospiraceae bacterium]